MANNGLDFTEIRRRVAALRKPDLHECLERLGMRKSGNKPELQNRLLDIFEDSCHLVSNGYGPPRDMWRLLSAQRIIDDVYNKMMNGGSTVGAGGSAAAPTAAAAAGTGAAPVDIKSAAASGAAGISAASATTPAAACGNGTAALHANPLPSNLAAYRASLRAGNAAAAAAGAGGSAATAFSRGVVRCSCGSTNTDRQTMLRCKGAGCGVWQHAQCVGVSAGGRPAGDDFYCELCRAKRADPFWQVVDPDITTALRLSSTGRQTLVNGTPQQVRSVERQLNVAPNVHQLYRNRQADHQLQLVCLQMNDPVPFRLHWPLGAALEVNNVQYRVYTRNTTQKLGANGRDEPANIGLLCPMGRSRITMQCTDNAAYVMLVLLVRRRSVEEVRQLMASPLSIQDALARVRQQLRNDDDDEVQTGATVLSLRCPITGSRLRTPARFSEVPGLTCFDLEAFLEGAARTRKWQCPISMTHSTVHSLQIDTYMQRILTALSAHPSVTEVEVQADGTWRPAGWASDRFFGIEEEDPLAGGAAGGGGDDSDDEEETDEEEELRRAAAAVTGQKRKRAPSPDVIDLASSDEDEDETGGGGSAGGARPAGSVPPPPQQQAGGTVAAARPQAANGTLPPARPQPQPHHQHPQPQAHPATAAGGPTVAPSGGLRIHLPTRRLVTTGAPGATAPGAAIAAAGQGVVATHRQHFEQLATVGQQRAHSLPAPHTHVHATATATAAHPPSHGLAAQPPRPPPQQQQPQLAHGMVQTQQPLAQPPPGRAIDLMAPAPAPVGVIGVSSQRQTVTAAARHPIRITTAVTAAGSGAAAAPALAPAGPQEFLPVRSSAPPALGSASATVDAMAPGLPSITPYQPQPLAAAGGVQGQGPAGAGAAAMPRWLAGNGSVVNPHPHVQQAHSQPVAPQQAQQLAPQHAQKVPPQAQAQAQQQAAQPTWIRMVPQQQQPQLQQQLQQQPLYLQHPQPYPHQPPQQPQQDQQPEHVHAQQHAYHRATEQPQPQLQPGQLYGHASLGAASTAGGHTGAGALRIAPFDRASAPETIELLSDDDD